MQDASTECENKPIQQQIALAQITVVPRRLHEDGEALLALGKSLRQGQLQAIGVMEVAEQPGHYHLIWGERRVRAAQRVGITHLEAVVLPPMEAAAALMISWRENTERADLTDVERLGMIELARKVLGGGPWRIAEAALRITAIDRKRVMALNRLDPEALVEVGRHGIRAYVVEPLLVLIRQRRDTGQRSVPEMMQVRIIRELAAHPSVEYCRHLVQTYYPPASATQRPEPERLVAAFASRLDGLTDAIHAVRQASLLSDPLERTSLQGRLGRSIHQLQRLQLELGAVLATQAP